MLPGPLEHKSLQGPIIGSDRLIIALKQLYRQDGRAQIVVHEIGVKHYGASEIPPMIRAYQRDMPIISKNDPLVKLISGRLNFKKNAGVAAGDMLIFRRYYQVAQSHYARIVR